MPRPERFTEEVWAERRKEQAKIDDDAFRRVHAPTERDIDDDVALAAKLIGTLGIPRDGRRARRAEIKVEVEKAISELMGFLGEVRLEWKVRNKIRPDLSLPIVGGVQPTHGEMHVTLNAGLKHAEELRDWYRSLPATLLSKSTVSFTEGSPAFGIVIERLAEVLAHLTAKHKPRRGPQPGRRAAAQLAARYLIRFIDRHAPDAPAEARRRFVFCAMRDLGIDLPDLRDDPGDFAIWFGEVEALASPPDTGT
jgi:hypothetical protein